MCILSQYATTGLHPETFTQKRGMIQFAVLKAAVWRKSRAGRSNEEDREEIIQARTDCDLGQGGE